VIDGPLLLAVAFVPQPPLGQRRAMFFSGMYGSEITEVIAAYREAGECSTAKRCY
jgi:hypothetical protein